jgi:hypothetical protein
LQKALPPLWKASLRAFDGAIVEDVGDQLRRVPNDVIHVREITHAYRLS